MALNALLKKFFGTESDRRIKSFAPIVEAINALEPTYEAMSDDDLRAETAAMRAALEAGEKDLDDLIEPAFALVREASKRTLGLRHFDVQLMGGLVLHEGDIAEMKTGEGKTLVATLAVFLNALPANGVHVVTVNDYLAQRDANWMGQVYRFLGLSVGVIVHGITDEDRKAAYTADVTYATNNELGFDYLRDNMKHEESQMVQRKHVYAIVDEVDSILIDEARTPLIISGALADRSDLYVSLNKVAETLQPEHYEIDEKARSVSLSEVGNEFAEEHLRSIGLLTEGHLYDLDNISLVHHLGQALKAHQLFKRDRDYIVRDGAVVIIDEFTGRMMPGRRFSEGLHQSLEAKEEVEIQPENQTMASVTFQNYFRLYDKLGGMTGTALTEAEEFSEIYGLEVVEVPTNVPVSRQDDDDEVYRTQEEKLSAIVETIRDCSTRGQPILVGTVSIDKSEQLSEALDKVQIKHQVLNARHHEQEAGIVALAGVPGSVTIATNMAGRGTDIQLGGNLEMRVAIEGEGLEGGALEAKTVEIKAEIDAAKKKAIDAGGLFVLATERHESRRIDNQLRGRSGRQGDPGKSRFYLALDDDLMRIFGSERMDKMLSSLGIEEGEAIVHPWINKAIERAQKKVEARNYDIRKNVLKYDNVLNDQRKVIFEQRRDLMAEPSVEETVDDMRASTVEMMIGRFTPPGAYTDQWKLDEFEAHASKVFNNPLPIKAWGEEEGIGAEELNRKILDAVDKLAAKKRIEIGKELSVRVEKSVLMQTLDQLWRTHIERLEHLRQVIGYRGLAQRDPLQEYKSEAFELFDHLLANLRENVTGNLLRIEMAEREAPVLEVPEGVETRGGSENEQIESAQEPTTAQAMSKIPRNAACPCGSGKKYKHCHGKL